MLEKELSLAEMIVYVYNDYTRPEEEIWKNQINDFRGKMKVRAYCPMWEKQVATLGLLNKIKGQNLRPDEIAIEVEQLFTMECINLYTNIEVEEEITTEVFTPEVLDAFNLSAIYDEIWDIAGYDIERFHMMIDNSLNWSHIFDLVNSFGSFDAHKIDELINEIKEARSELSDEKLDTLKQLSTINKRSNDFASYVDAAIVKSLEDVTPEKIVEWRNKQDIFTNLDEVLTENAKKEIFEDIQKYFDEHLELGIQVDQEEVEDVYKYLSSKNEEAINKIDIAIAEENRASIQQGVTSQMIKLLSKKNALKNRYKKEEELIRLADTVMSMDGSSIDELKEIIEQYQKK